MSVRTGRSPHILGSGNVIGVYVEMEIHECGVCGVTFGLSKGFANARRNDHETWCCPNGHNWSWSGESETETLRRQLSNERDRVARERANRDQAEASLRATKGVVTKQKKKLARVAAGVCPCCNRSFQDLGRHMETKHPGFERDSTA